MLTFLRCLSLQRVIIIFIIYTNTMSYIFKIYVSSHHIFFIYLVISLYIIIIVLITIVVIITTLPGDVLRYQ